MHGSQQNSEWLERSKAAVWHPCTQMRQHDPGASEPLPLIPIASARGAWLYDFEDQRYLDGISSWWVNLFGHANRYINAALRDQLEKLEHVMLAGFTHTPAVELSERLAALCGHRLGHAFYASDGASATEIALKMSFHYWRNTGREAKQEFICLQNSYHGETLGALSVTDVQLFRDAYEPLLRLAKIVPTPDSRQAENGETAAETARRAAAALEEYLQKNHQTTAALIVEPLVQCAAGMIMYDPEYLRQARMLCDRYEVHLICDEIAVGYGRTGSFLAHNQAAIQPDILCLSKGITGGYLPLSVVMCTDKIYQAFYDDRTERAFLHSHSYTGNPLACRAALATLDLFEQQAVLDSNQGRSDKIYAALQSVQERIQVRNLRRCGMIFAFDVVGVDAAFSHFYYQEALQRQALIRPLDNTVYLMPPYILDDSEIDHLTGATIQALDATLGKLST